MPSATLTRAASATRPTTLARVIHSEWIKLRSLRSTWITIVSLLVVIVGFGLMAAAVSSGSLQPPANDPAGADAGRMGRNPLATVLAGANLAVLVVAVFGSVVGAREFSTGMIRSSFSAVPKRLPVLWAKLIAFSALVIPAVFASVVVAFTLGMNVIAGAGKPTLAWSDDGVMRSVLGTAAYVVGLGVIGLALGILMRNTAAAIGTVLGAVLFLPALASVLLPSDWSTVLKFLPSNAGTAFTSLSASGQDLLAPNSGALVFVVWIVVAVVAAAFAIQRRDA